MGVKGTEVTPGDRGCLPPVKRPWSSPDPGNVHIPHPSRRLVKNGLLQLPATPLAQLVEITAKNSAGPKHHLKVGNLPSGCIFSLQRGFSLLIFKSC